MKELFQRVEFNHDGSLDETLACVTADLTSTVNVGSWMEGRGGLPQTAGTQVVVLPMQVDTAFDFFVQGYEG